LFRFRLAITLAASSALVCTMSWAQETPKPATEAPVASSGSTEQSEVPQVPGISGLLKGLNAGLTVSGYHDSATGWATLSQLALGYTFNDRFAVDVTAPIYMFRLAQTRVTNPKPGALLVPLRAEVGDVVIAFHAEFQPRSLQYEATFAATAPSGDSLFGLTTGRPTFDFTNHVEHSFSRITPMLELGVGDSAALVNRLVTKDYTSLGPLAHFQFGFAVPLPLGASFQTNAYEQLPIGDQKIYQSTVKGKTTTLVVSGHSVTEDNGFTSSFDIPIDAHTTLSTYYNRSLRLRDDVVSIGLTYVLRGSKPAKQLSDADLIRSLQEPVDPVTPPVPPPTAPPPPPPH
jgi:hypothetical protein